MEVPGMRDGAGRGEYAHVDGDFHSLHLGRTKPGHPVFCPCALWSTWQFLNSMEKCAYYLGMPQVWAPMLGIIV